VIFAYPREFAIDAIEQRVPDVAAARALMRDRCPALLPIIEQRLARFAPLLADQPAQMIRAGENAVLIAYCRVAFRHGSWGEDYHPYHNEGHIIEILGARIERLIETIGMQALKVSDWFLLALFAATHDLRQRETPFVESGIGSNERASVEEALRILRICGFLPDQHRDIFMGIELMIAGSTFDARPPPSMLEYNTAELLVQSRGALARKLDKKLDKHVPGWRSDARIVHALKLAMIAADLDTANVAEPFALFMASAERLCLEREMRSHRDPNSAAAAMPMLNFLTEGQERYFFDLHRFASDPGRRTFEAAKLENAGKLKTLIADLHAQAEQSGPPASGTQVMNIFHRLVAAAG
jgi:hypothetical protein